jgi:hypothetical protein
VLVVENVPMEFAARVIIAAQDAPKVPLGLILPVADRDRVQPKARNAKTK